MDSTTRGLNHVKKGLQLKRGIVKKVMSEVEKTKEEVEKELQEAKALAEKERAEKAAIVEELKAEREKKRLAQEEAEKLKQTPKETGDPVEVVNRILQEKEAQSVKGAFEAAKAEIKRTYNEFSPETDTAGIVFNKFENDLAKFNFDGLKTKEEILARMKEVYEFANRNRKTPEDQPDFYRGNKPTPGNAPVNDSVTLSDKEVRLLKDLNISKEKYLEMKAKRPHYVNQLLSIRS